MLLFGLNLSTLFTPRGGFIARKQIPARGHQVRLHQAKSLRNIFLSMSLSLDTPESGPHIGDDVKTDSMAEDDVNDKYGGYLDDARIVSIPLPLDVYLEESAQGKVYVDEVIPRGNAEKTGCVFEGDVVIAVSLPFGDALHPVPSLGGLDLVQEHISSRGEGLEFRMALIPSNIEALRQEAVDAQDAQMTYAQMGEIAKKIFTEEYPFAPSHQEDVQEGQLDFEILREEGFDI